jgi:hypothetical protein
VTAPRLQASYEIAGVTVALQHLRAGDGSWVRMIPCTDGCRPYGPAGAARARGRPGIPARLGEVSLEAGHGAIRN